MTTPKQNLANVERLFVSYLERLIGEIKKANLYFKAWKSINSYTREYHTELNQAPTFWGSARDAYLETALICLCRIVEENSDVLSIWKFLNFADANQGIFTTEAFSRRMISKVGYEEQIKSYRPITHKIIEEDKKRIKNLEPTIANLKTWRVKVLAHIDKQFLNQEIDIVTAYPIKIEKIEKLIVTIMEVLNKYSAAYNSSRWLIDMPFESGLQTVLDSIRFELKETRKQRGLGNPKEIDF